MLKNQVTTRAAVLCLALASRLPADSARLDLETSWQLPGVFRTRAELTGSAARAVLAWSGEGPPGRGTLAYGVSCPWIRFGTLSPAGLIRETAHPLAYGPGSDVFREETGLVLDGSPLSPSRPGVIVFPVPGSLGLYCREAAGGRGEMGVVARAMPFDGLRVEGLAAAAQPPAGAPDGWCEGSAPGGLVGIAAARLALDRPGGRASITLGGSGGERAAPGAFLHASFGLGGTPCSAAFLLGLADSTYAALSGARCTEKLKAGGEVRIRRGAGALEAGCSFTAHQSPFSPEAVPAGDWNVTVAVERQLAPGSDQGHVRLEARGNLRRESDGTRADRCAFDAALALPVAGFVLEAGAAAVVSGTDLHAELRWAPPRRTPRLWLDARLSDCGPGCLLSVEAGMRLMRPWGDIWVAVGTEGWWPGQDGQAGTFQLRTGWQSLSRAFPTRRQGGPPAQGTSPGAVRPPTPPAR